MSDELIAPSKEESTGGPNSRPMSGFGEAPADAGAPLAELAGASPDHEPLLLEQDIPGGCVDPSKLITALRTKFGIGSYKVLVSNVLIGS